MAAASSNEFQLIVPKTAETVDIKLGSNFIVPCHLSPEISAVDMEIRWFKETDCVCIYKNRQMTEGKGYKDRVNLFTNELQERGDVSLQLKNFKRTDAGLYLCQVISESTTVEMTVQVKEAREDPDVHSMSQPLTFQSKYVQLTLHEINKTWGKRQRMKMEESALMTELVVNNIEEFHQKLFKAFRDQSKKLKQTELKLKETVIDLGKTIESKNHELHVKHQELETNKKTQMEMREQLKEMQIKLTNITKQLTETSIKNKENQLLQKTKDTELENLKTLMNEKEKLLNDTVKELEASKHQQETLRKRIRNLEGLKVFCMFAGKTNNMSHRSFTETLLNQIQNLKETSTVDESDIVLVFCPIVSGAETDIEAALKRFDDSTASKLNVLVVLHQMFDPEKIVPDSSRCVNRTDILTVDCLFYEDTGLLECQKNNDAMDKVVNWLKEQGEKMGVNVSLRQTEDASNSDTFNPENSVQTPSSTTKDDASNPDALNPVKSEQTPPPPSGLRLFSIVTGKTNDSYKKFTDILINRFLDLRQVPAVDQSNIVLVFCPIVSQAGTDIEAALKTFTDSTVYKLKVLVVLHHTYDPEKTVPDSSRCVNRTDILTVDCLFYEDTGLLECQKNQDAMDKVVNWLREQWLKRGLNVSLRKKRSTGSISFWPSSWIQWGYSGNNTKPERSSSSRQGQVKYSFSLIGDTHKSHVDFIQALHKQIPGLMKVSTEQESDVILFFCPVLAGLHCHHALQEVNKRKDKLAVLIFLHNKLDAASFPNNSEIVNRPDVYVVDYVFYDTIGQPASQMKRNAVYAVSHWLNTKMA